MLRKPRYRQSKRKTPSASPRPNDIGKAAENDFERIWNKYGKRAYVHRFPDSHDLYGLNGTLVKTLGQPSDYLVTFDGATFFAEVKATRNAKGFAVSSLEPSQYAAAVKTLAAGGVYLIFIYSHHLGMWLCVPAQHVINQKGRIPWQNLTTWQWKPSGD